VPRGLKLGGSDLVAESRMRRGHVHAHITRACVHSGPGWGSDGDGLYGHMRPAGRGLGSRMVRPSLRPRAVGPHFEGIRAGAAAAGRTGTGCPCVLARGISVTQTSMAQHTTGLPLPLAAATASARAPW
jgi:hypothetical protein